MFQDDSLINLDLAQICMYLMLGDWLISIWFIFIFIYLKVKNIYYLVFVFTISQ